MLPPLIPIACSGPGAAQAIVEASRLGWVLFGIAVCVVCVGVGVRLALGTRVRSVGTVIGALLLLTHPAWWLSARMGDCGAMRELMSHGWSGAIGLWLLIALLVAAGRWARRGSER